MSSCNTNTLQWFYLYTNEGDENIKNLFGGVWVSRFKRWQIPLTMITLVSSYLQSIEDKSINQVKDQDQVKDQNDKPRKSIKRKKKIHRENSFNNELINSSDEEI